MDRVAGSFGFPFRSGAARAWLVGIPLLVLFPLGLVALLGYAVAVTRSAIADPEAGPPSWRPLSGLIRDGLLLAGVLIVLTSPFAALAALLAPRLTGLLVGLVHDPSLRGATAWVIGAAIAGLPWGILLLVLMPPATARFAITGSPRDLLDIPGALATVCRRFPAWNLAVVAIVTAWAIGLCGLGLVLVGVVPGVLYAILVSAHATASLADA
jgi:hypothetical protein